MKIPKVPKIVKIVVVLVVILILASLAAAGIVALDVMSNFATGSEKLTPDGSVTGKALVVYDPGVTGTAKDVATKIANNLKSNGYEVVLAGVKSVAAANISGYDVIVAGGPVYSGKVSSSVYSYLEGLHAPGNVKVGAFSTGTYRSEDKVDKVFPALETTKAVVMLFPDDNADKICADLVTALLQ
jgi:flavodoxin